MSEKRSDHERTDRFCPDWETEKEFITFTPKPNLAIAVRYTRKQMGDACEMLVAAEVTLAGVPAMKAPDNWPGYDVLAQPLDRGPQRISVKSRTFKRGGDTFVTFDADDVFDWLAIVFLPGADLTARRFFIIPRAVAEAKARRGKETSKTASERYWRQDEVATLFERYENNFTLRLEPSRVGRCPIASV